MSKKIQIELEGAWVLRHRKDEKLPVAKLEEAFRADHFSVEEKSLTTLTLLTEEAQEDERLVKHVMDTFVNTYPGEDAENILTLTVSEAAPVTKDEEKDGEDEEAKKAVEELEKLLGSQGSLADRLRALAQECPITDEPAPARHGTPEEVMGRINGLVGASEFKKLMAEIAAIAPGVVESGTYPVFYSRSYLFSIGDGCGLTTYLKLFAELLSATKLRPMSERPVDEEFLEPEKERPGYNTDPVDSLLQTLSDGDSDSVHLLCIDISEWITKTDTEHFKRLLRGVEKAAEDFIVVFRVPFLDKDVLADLNFSLNDLLSVKTVTFPPFSQEELKICAERELEGYGFKANKNAWEFFQLRIAEEKGDGKFYGLNTVKKVIREAAYAKLLADAKSKKSSRTLTQSDMRALCTVPTDTRSGQEQLDRLVGNESVKAKIQEILTQIELAKAENDERPCIHMRFVGNPGTGKTTVARILGKILKERGVLRIGKFYERAGRDFCGRYIGETAPRTASICRDAYGSVLFIDEAYSLYRGEDNERDFGKEAIDTLIAEMENHRDDFVVIMAGYTDDMERLMRSNQGLASRMPYILEFPNFTREQLYLIFESLVKERFKCDAGLLETARAYFEGLPDEVLSAKEFSNARFVRNLFERTWAKAAMRCQLGNKAGVVLTKEDFERAVSEKEFSFNTQKKSRLGF